jgi:hypothetical protein
MMTTKTDFPKKKKNLMKKSKKKIRSKGVLLSFFAQTKLWHRAYELLETREGKLRFSKEQITADDNDEIHILCICQFLREGVTRR